jgi:prepilin-type N-terminal cleavage/methylation domain-containing protein
MVGKFKSKRQEGFTIIEVLIVLAIAGLIMLVVFLAVPALQRNSRNTQRKNDISGILGAVQEVLNNNNGDLTKITNANVIAAAPTPAYYVYSSTAGSLMPADAVKATGAVTNAQTIDSLAIYYNAKCNGANIAVGTTRQVAVIYALESNGGTTLQCTAS